MKIHLKAIKLINSVKKSEILGVTCLWNILTLQEHRPSSSIQRKIGKI